MEKGQGADSSAQEGVTHEHIDHEKEDYEKDSAHIARDCADEGRGGFDSNTDDGIGFGVHVLGALRALRMTAACVSADMAAVE